MLEVCGQGEAVPSNNKVIRRVEPCIPDAFIQQR